MKKRILTLTLAAMMIVATLIGCGNDTTKENTTNNEVVTETPSPETNVPETDAPTTETPTPETNVPETETIDWEYSGSWEFPEARRCLWPGRRQFGCRIELCCW